MRTRPLFAFAARPDRGSPAITMRTFTLATALLVAVALPLSLDAASISAVDPTGDTFDGLPGVDLQGVTTFLAGDSFDVTLEYNPADFDPAVMMFALYFDTDSNPATGDPDGFGSGAMGLEFIVQHYACGGSDTATVQRWNGSVYPAVGLATVFPRSFNKIQVRGRLVGFSGATAVRMRAVSSECTSDSGSLGSLDSLPDAQLAPLLAPNNVPPAGPWLASAALPGYRTKVLINGNRIGTQVAECIEETICVAGALPDRVEVQVRVVGPKPNDYFWPTLVKFNTTSAEVWVEETATAAIRYYEMPATTQGVDDLPGLFDRGGFKDD